MKTHELREMSAEELAQHLADSQRELFNLRFQLSTRQVSDTSRMRQVRREIARVMTLVRERELEAEVE